MLYLEPNVAYVGSFVTSLVSQSVLDSKGVHFDTGGPRLYKDGVTKFLLHRTSGQYIFTAAGLPHCYPQNALGVLTTTATTSTASPATPSVESNNVAVAQAIKYSCATTPSAKEAANSIVFTQGIRHNTAVGATKLS